MSPQLREQVWSGSSVGRTLCVLPVWRVRIKGAGRHTKIKHDGREVI